MRAGQVWQSLAETVRHLRDGRTRDTAGRDSDLRASLHYDPASVRRRADIVTEVGLSPAEFVQRLVEREGGYRFQQDLERYTDLSPSTSCRLLRDPEAEGEINRSRVGRRTVVFLPETRAR